MSSKAQTAVTCELCYSEIDVKFYCVTCGQILCLKCRQTHSRNTRTKNDEVISLSDAGHLDKSKPTVILCDDHPTEEITLFCERCEKFICMECMDDHHRGHNIITSKKIKTRKAKLVPFMDDLKARKNVFSKALKNENCDHSQNIKCNNQIRTEISDQVNGIIKEVTSLRKEKFIELSAFQEKENQKRRGVLTSIHSSMEVLTTAIDLIQAAVDIGNPIRMEAAQNNAKQSVENLDVPPESTKVVIKYKHVSINRTTMIPLLGDIVTEDQGAEPKQQDPTVVGQKELSGVTHSKIDISNVGIVATIKARDTGNSIKLILPITKDTSWVAAASDRKLTLINRDGRTVRTSVQLCGDLSHIIDAKQFNNDFLLTCYEQHQVIRMAEDGNSKTTFSYVSPYYPFRLHVTHVMDVLLCLASTFCSQDPDAKVIRLNSNGDKIQTIQHDDKGGAIYSWPYRITSLESGEIIVSDQDQHRRVSCVNNDGRLMFIWNGFVQGREVDIFCPWCITHDTNNLFVTDYYNHRVYVLSIDGTEAKCLIDRSQGIQCPYGVTVGDHGQLNIKQYYNFSNSIAGQSALTRRKKIM